MIMHAHLAAFAAKHAAVTPPHAHGSIIVLAVLAGAAGLTLYGFRYTRRLVCWLIAFAAAVCAIGISVWTDALIALVTSGPGQVALVGLVVASGIGFYLVAVHDAQGRKIRQAKRDKRERAKKEGKKGRDYDDDDVSAELVLAGGKEIVVPRRSNALDRRSHHHHVGSPAVAAIFGTSFSLLVITFGLIMTDLWQSFTSLGSTVATQSARVNSGKAAAAAVRHHQSPGHVLLVGLLIFAAILYAAHRLHKFLNRPKKGGKNNNGGGGGNRGGRRKRGNRGGNRGGGGGGWGGDGVWPGGDEIPGGRTSAQELGWH